MRYKDLTIFSKHSKIEPCEHAVGFLCECAPDSSVFVTHSSPYTPEQMLGPLRDSEDAAALLSRKLCDDVVEFEGVNLLYVLEEQLIEELTLLARYMHLDRWIEANEFKFVRCPGAPEVIGRLSSLARLTGSHYELAGEEQHRSEFVRKLNMHVSREGFGPSALGGLAKRGWDRRFPLVSKLLGAIPHRLFEVPEGGLWFYTTAYNYTSIGLAYERYLPTKLHYLYEDAGTGGRRLREAGRHGLNLYAFARRSDLPSVREVRQYADHIAIALRRTKLVGQASLLRDAYLAGNQFRHFAERLLPLLMLETRAARRFLDAVQPEMVIVGNASFERTLLLQARKRRIPTVLLQHGVVHATYRVVDQPVDVFLSRGEFFRSLLFPSLKDRTVVANAAQPTAAYATDARPDNRSDLLFVAGACDVMPFFHELDLEEIVRALIRAASREQRRLVVRVHPMDSVTAYKRMVTRVARKEPAAPRIVYSQGPGLEDVLRGSAVAVLYFSTVFLECLRLGIPILSFAWHDFPYKREYEQRGIFHFARNLKDLDEVAARGLRGELPANRGKLQELLAPTSPEVLADLFGAMAPHKPNAAVTP
jgi:hypothetical protein